MSERNIGPDIAQLCANEIEDEFHQKKDKDKPSLYEINLDGMSNFEYGYYDEARHLFQQSLRLDPGNSKVWGRYGVSLCKSAGSREQITQYWQEGAGFL